MSEPTPLEAIFFAALEKPAAERGSYLEEACRGDADLRRRVERMLTAQMEAASFLETPPSAIVREAIPTIDQAPLEKPGTQIGPYKLLQQIGEGGMGVVYMAEQHKPVKRRVALKIIKPGMDSRQVIARFEAERQALSLMDHPNIAKVLDAGTTESGRPYFVMELVKGQPITQYCDEKHFTPRQRLELVLPVCQAIQHAHQKGIIHRDIKPTNILVAEYDQQPVPKVIDFGVAKATSHTLTEKTMFTGIGQIVGTLEYMSPEQAKVNQLDIDTRSDIYSLGVLLYELLTGSTPFDRQRLRSAAFDEMLRIIREEEPPKPSTRLSESSDSLPSISAQRHTEPAKLTKLVRGELDWIVMKALEKDRSRRYETASGFAMDVQRYLADDPVQACPPSARYRFRKFFRRNKSLFLTAGIVAAALAIGIVGTTWQAIRATAEAERAKTEAAITRAVNEFVNEDLLGQANPQNEPDREITLYSVVERAAESVESRFRNQPLVEAAIRQTLGNVYNRLGDYAKAEAQHRAALKIHRRELGLRHTVTAASMTGLAADLNQQQGHVEAEKMQREALEINLEAFGPEHPATLDSKSGLARSSTGQGRFAEAEQLHRQVYEVRVRVLGPEHHETLVSRTLTGEALLRQGRAAEAEAVFREVLATRRRVLRGDHPAIPNTLEFLARALLAQDRLTEAEELLREVVEVRKRVLLSQHPATVRSTKALARVRQMLEAKK